MCCADHATSVRHAHAIPSREPLVWRLVPALVQQMGAAIPNCCGRNR
jgi:hypothetical protein